MQDTEFDNLVSNKQRRLDNRTMKILDKWGVKGEMNEMNIRRAASSYARIQILNRVLRWITIGAVLFIVALLGMMIGSVVLGIDISKDVKVKNEYLVSRNSNEALQTSEAFYSSSSNLRLNAPISEIKAIKNLKFTTKDKSSIQFNVVSFYYVVGKTLTFYGHKHVANVLANGTVELFPIENNNGARSVDVSKREETTGYQSTSTTTNQLSNLIEISSCDGLLNLNKNGNYSLTTNLVCNFSEPINVVGGFSGWFNGNLNFITLNMERDGEAALFSSLKGSNIKNLLVNGTITGKGKCAALAVETDVNTFVTHCGTYANIICHQSSTGITSIGGFSATLVNPSNSESPIIWENCVSQNNITMVATDKSTVYQGAFYGTAQTRVNNQNKFCYSVSNFNVYGTDVHTSSFGYRLHDLTNTKNTRYNDTDCYDLQGEEYINFCVNFFIENLYEHQECCDGFSSCPYIECDWDGTYCPCRGKRSDPGVFNYNTYRKIFPSLKSSSNCGN